METDSADGERRALFVSGLRAMADYFEAHDAVPTPWGCSVNVFISSKDELAQIARLGPWEKGAQEGYFWLRRAFSGGVILDLNVNRASVCERIVTGTRTVAAVPEHEVDVVEWRCDEPLLAPVPPVPAVEPAPLHVATAVITMADSEFI